LNKKVLIIPNDLGGGLGHVRRCNFFAKILKEDGWEIAFLCHKKNTQRYFDSSNHIYQVSFNFDNWSTLVRSRIKPIHFRPQQKLLKEPYFWEFNSLNYQVLRDGYFTPSIVQHRFNKMAKIVDLWKPTIIISDGHLLSYFLGRIFGIPVFQNVRYAVFPDKNNFIWWKDIPNSLIPPSSTQAFLPLFDRIQENLFQDAQKLLKGDAYLIPGTPELEPIETSFPHLFYGYFINTHWDERLLKIDKKKRLKKIYITVGGGAKRTHIAEYYNIILQSLIRKDYQLIFSDPFEVLLSNKKSINYPNVTILKWVESSSVFPYLNLVIHHGGYGTTMETLWWGIPSLIIPYHSEQEGNGKRIEKLKSGKVIPIAEEPYQSVKFDYYYGETSMLGGFNFRLTEEEIDSVVNDLISNHEYKNNVLGQSYNLKLRFNREYILNFIQKNS
jgi:UDP:flavonoid glycosyltransferase YjiC (YdhE family)